MDDGLPAEADALYDERPEEFVSARNALAKTLRADKRRDEASRVAALRRPSVAAWALNQVARHEPALVADLLDAGAALQDATARAVAGTARDVRGPSDALRRALDAVVEAAARRAGQAGSGQVAQRATATLHAAIADGALGARLRAGRLTDDADPPGFGFGLDLPLPPAAPPAEDAPPAEEAARAAEAAARAAERARRQAEYERLAARASTAEAAARAARAAADAARAALDELA